VVSLVPAGAAVVFGRIACSLTWFGSLAGLAWTAPRESRREAAVAAAFIAGIWVLANFATIGRPDSIACALAAIALARAIRRGKADLLCIALLVLVPWVKPTLIGLPTGAILGAALADRNNARRTLGTAVVLAGGSAAIAFVASGGAVFTHVIRSNAQAFTLTAWLDQVPARLPFFAPLFAWAAWVGWRDRRSTGTRIGLAALGGAVAWTLFAVAKTGSASNYWMEPSIAAVALIARAQPGPVRVGGTDFRHVVVALVAVLWADIASVRGALEHGQRMRADAAFVATIRERAGFGNDQVIAADEAGIELVLNDRILMPTYQMVHLVRAGKFPAALWIAELTSPRTGGFVEHTGQLRLASDLQRALEERHCMVIEEGGFRVWRRR
jgi:hypothetical protein